MTIKLTAKFTGGPIVRLILNVFTKLDPNNIIVSI